MYDDLDWNMADTVAEIRALAGKSASQAIEENKKTVLLAWKAVYLMEKTAGQEGLLAMEDRLEYFRQAGVPFYDVLETMIHMLVDGMGNSFVLEVMTNDFYTRKQDAVTVLILYFYMSCVLDIEENFRIGLTKETGMKSEGQNIIFLPTVNSALDLMEKKLELIPKEYQKEFMEVLYFC